MIVLLLINLVLIAFLFWLYKQFPKSNIYFMLKQFGLLEAAWSGFLFMFCLIDFFDIMEATGDGKTLLEAAGKERIVTLFILCGFGIIHFLIFSVIVARLLNKRGF